MDNTLITGRSGSGKTTLLKSLDLDNIVFADDFVKEVLYKNGHEVYSELLKAYPTLTEGDFINTKELGKIILNDETELDKVNEIVSPFIKQWLTNLPDGTIVEMATYINLENEYKDFFSKIILITRNNRNLSKFSYAGKGIDPIKDVNIKYDFLIENNDTLESATSELKEII